jgi:O-antigen/teichoic acid export membrane protein
MDNLQNKVIKSVFWVGGMKLVSQMISWSVTIFLIRILSPEDYGLMGIALAYKLLISIFFDFSIGEAILQKKEITDTDTSTAFWICLLSAVFLYTITWNIAPVWADFFSNDALVEIVRVIGISIIFLSIKEIPGRLLARQFEFKRRSQFELIAAVLCLIVSFALAIGGYGVWALVIGELVKDAVLAVLIFAYLKWFPLFVFSLRSAADLLKYGIPVTGHYILEYISTKSDSLIIGKVLGQDVLGYYTVAMSVSRIPVAKGIQIIQTVIFPLFSAVQHDLGEFQKYFYRICYMVSVIFFPVFFGMLAVSEEIVVLILSPKWMPSLFTFQIFCVLGLLLSYSGIFIVILKSRANTRAIFRYSLYSVMLFPAGFYFSADYGLTGIALCWAVIFPILFGYLFYSVTKEIKVSIVQTLKKVANSFIGALLMVVVVYLSKVMVFDGEVSVLSFVGSIVFGAVIYVGYFWVFSRHTFHDVVTIWKSLKS